MAMITSVSREQALGNISSYFHPILQVVIDEYILLGEHVLLAADSTRHEIGDQEGISLGKMIMQEDDISTHKDVVRGWVTLLVVTNQRWIRVSGGQYSHELRIETDTDFFGKLDRFFDKKRLKFNWLIPLDEFPLEWLRKRKKTIREYATERIRILPLSELNVVKREEFTILDKTTTPGSQLHLLSLYFGSGLYYSLKYNDGILLHQLLQLASINGGVIPVETGDKPKGDHGVENSVQKLQQLKLMLDQGLITAKEYQAKKSELLSRM